MEQHQLRIARSPDQGAEPSALADVHELATDLRRAAEGQPVFLGVLVEQPELVVFDPLYPAHPDSSIPTPAPATLGPQVRAGQPGLGPLCPRRWR